MGVLKRKQNPFGSIYKLPLKSGEHSYIKLLDEYKWGDLIAILKGKHTIDLEEEILKNLEVEFEVFTIIPSFKGYKNFRKVINGDGVRSGIPIYMKSIVQTKEGKFKWEIVNPMDINKKSYITETDEFTKLMSPFAMFPPNIIKKMIEDGFILDKWDFDNDYDHEAPLDESNRGYFYKKNGKFMSESTNQFKDAYDEYIQYIEECKTRDEATEQFKTNNKNWLEEDDEKYDLWFGLAKAQKDSGHLDNDVYEKVKQMIESGDALNNWKERDASEETLKERKKYFAKFLKILEK